MIRRFFHFDFVHISQRKSNLLRVSAKIFAADTDEKNNKKRISKCVCGKNLPQPHFADSHIGYLDFGISVFF